MSSVVSCVLDLTFGHLWNKLRDYTAEKLKEGDLTDEECRELVVRELDDIKTKLDGLARTDLLSSVSFLKEGVRFLYCSLETQSGEGNWPQKQGARMAGDNRISRDVDELELQEDPYFEKVLEFSRKINSFDITSAERYASAKSCFADARKEATRAFNNKSLSTADRIMAVKLRVISRILENLEDPIAATDVCKLYLEELHELEAVREIFSVHFRGGIKSLFNKRKRLRMMATVIMISYLLANFAIIFAKKEFTLVEWPTIRISERTFHPLMDVEARNLMNNFGVRPPNRFNFNELVYNDRRIMEEIMNNDFRENVVEVITEEDEIHFAFHDACQTLKEKARILHEVTMNQDDDIYIMTYVIEQTDCKMLSFEFHMYLSDVRGHVRTEFKLDLLTTAENKYRASLPSGPLEEPLPLVPNDIELTVGNDRNIYLGHLRCVYICNASGQLIRHFETIQDNDILSISDTNEITSAKYNGRIVHTYSRNGELKHQFEVVPGQQIYDMVFNQVKHKIFILTHNSETVFQLQCYSVLGELYKTIPLHVSLDFGALSVLPSGLVAIVHKRGFILT